MVSRSLESILSLPTILSPNHLLGNCSLPLLLNTNLWTIHCSQPALHPSLLFFSPSLYSLDLSLMASNIESSQNSTKVVMPAPLWWQPSTRWVAISHLPLHLHNPNVLASLVAYFGSLISFSYPANFRDKKIVMVLVGNCLITKIPHILLVREGEKVFPVKIQVIFQAKISAEGLIFDPLDSGDGFCAFYSNGQCPVNSVLQHGSTYPLVPATLSHVHNRDRKKVPTHVPDVDSSSPKTVRGSVPFNLTPQRGSLLVSSPPNSKLLGFTNIAQSLNSAILKFTSDATATTLESDPSYKDRSHQSPNPWNSQLTTAVLNLTNNSSSHGQDVDLSCEEKTQLVHSTENNCKTRKNVSSVTFDLPVASGDLTLHKIGKSHMAKVNAEVTSYSTGQFATCNLNLVESAASHSRFATPPKVYTRRTRVETTRTVSVEEHLAGEVADILGEKYLRN